MASVKNVSEQTENNKKFQGWEKMRQHNEKNQMNLYQLWVKLNKCKIR